MTINTQKLRDLIRQACPLPWTLATSNSWRRIVDPYSVPVVSPCNQPDGHPDLAFPGGVEGPTARLLIEGVNALPALLDQIDAQAAEIERLREVLAGLPQDAIDGGWTAAGISKYAKGLEAERDRLRAALETIEQWKEPVVESRGEAVSMSVAYGSNGVRDHFRGVARAALQGDQHGQ